MNNLESEIIETAQHLNSLIATYVLTKNPSTPLIPYYSYLHRNLEKIGEIIEKDSQNPETVANVGTILKKSDEARKECLESTLEEDGAEKDETCMVLNSDVYKLLLEEEKQKKNFKDILLTIKNNKRTVETVNQKLSEYMKTLKDFYGEITVKTLKDNYDDSFEIIFYTSKIDDVVINTLEQYKDYEVYDVRCEQYCTLPPIDRKIIILDNRKVKSW